MPGSINTSNLLAGAPMSHGAFGNTTNEFSSANMNTVLAEIEKTQSFTMDWGTKVANVEHYGRALGLSSSDDWTQAVRNAIADTTKTLIYLPGFYQVTGPIYLPFHKILVSDRGYYTWTGGLVRNGASGQHLLQIGGGHGVANVSLRSEDNSAGSVVLFKYDITQEPVDLPGRIHSDWWGDGSEYLDENSDGFFVNNYLAGSGMIVRSGIQGWHMSGSTFDVTGTGNIWVDSANGGFMSNNHLLGNRFFGSGGTYNLKLERFNANLLDGNVIDYGTNGIGIHLSNSIGNVWGTNQIQGCVVGMQIDNCGTDSANYNDFGNMIVLHTQSQKLIVNNSKNQLFNSFTCGKSSVGSIEQYGLTSDGSAQIQTNGTCERIVFGRVALATGIGVNGLVLGSGTTKSGATVLLANGVASPFVNGGGVTNFADRVL